MNATTQTAIRADRPAVPRLEFIDVRKAFGDLVVLDGVTIRVDPGEVVCVIGPSGSGKSTLLKCANALEPIQGGRIVFDGQPLPADAEGIRRVRRRMGMVFQSFELFPHMTALANVEAGPRTVLGMGVASARARGRCRSGKIQASAAATSAATTVAANTAFQLKRAAPHSASAGPSALVAIMMPPKRPMA